MNTTQAPLRNAAFVSGIGQTEFRRRGKHTDRTEFELCCEAIQSAAADAGIDASDIDGFASYANERQEPVMLQVALGIETLKFSNMVWGGGAGGTSAAVMNAVMAIKSGLCRHIVVYRSICQGQFYRFGQMRPRPIHQNFTGPFGQGPPIHGVSLVARRHMHEYGTTERQFAEVATSFREHANRNPNAIFFDRKLTVEDHQASRMIASPLRLFDNCLETDGAVAIVVSAPDHAPDSPNPAAWIRSVAHASGPRWGTGPSGSNNMPLDDYASTNSRPAAKQLWANAGLGPEDVDVAQFYDAFTPIPIMHLEEYGFVKPGEGGPFVEDGGLRLGGPLPSNTAGGQLSEAYLQGLNLVLEGVRQIRGTSTSQVTDAEVSLVTSGGALGHKSAVLFCAER